MTFGVGAAATTAASGAYGTKARKAAVRNAHLAESQAELVAHNVLQMHRAVSILPPSSSTSSSSTSSSSSSSSSNRLLCYPKDCFYGASTAPLLACVSLGPNNGIIVFNDLVLGGFLFGVLGGLVKFIIERS